MIRDLLAVRHLEQVGPLLERYTEPAVAFWIAEKTASGKSRLGGMPRLPRSFAWPTSKERPLDFLLQIDLAEIAGIGLPSALPPVGHLTFFYDLVNQPWGYDPARQDGFSVGYFPDADLAPAEPSDSASLLPEFNLSFGAARTLPQIGSRAYERLEREAGLDEHQWARYFELLEAFENQFYPHAGSRHRLLGHSSNVQGDMQLEAALVTAGLYCGDATGYEDPRAQGIAASADEWQLLLQLDSDDRADLMWGDGGMLYFWIRAEDLAERRFEKVWMTLQCG
jgi:uncharacterized protein YwqG